MSFQKKLELFKHDLQGELLHFPKLLKHTKGRKYHNHMLVQFIETLIDDFKARCDDISLGRLPLLFTQDLFLVTNVSEFSEANHTFKYVCATSIQIELIDLQENVALKEERRGDGLAITDGGNGDVAGGGVTLYLQTDGVARGDSGLTWKKTLPQMAAVSVCFRVKLLQTRETNYVVSYATEASGNEIFVDVRYYQKEIRMGCCRDAVYSIFSANVSLMTWLHVCFAMDLKAGQVHFKEGGRVVQTLDSRKKTEGVTGGGVLMLGQDQDVVGGGTEATQSLHGYLADLQLLDRVLSQSEMAAYTSCADGMDWNALVNFNDVEESFDFGEVTNLVDLAYESACSGFDIHASLFPESRVFMDSDLFCSSLGGSLILPKKPIENKMITDLGMKYCKIGRIWLGLEYDGGADFKEYGTNNTLSYAPWYNKVLADANTYGILVNKFDLGENNWGVSTRDRKLCTACGRDEPFTLTVRGLCKDSKFDREFLVHGYQNLKPSLYGVKSSRMSWIAYNLERDVFSGYWHMVVSAEPHIEANMIMETRYSYPVGTHTWKIINDICTGDEKRLKLTTCSVGKFTCDDGSCINVTLRCDKKIDCADASDEDRCNPVLIPKGYDKTLPPPFTDNKFPATIQVDVDFKFIRSIMILEFSLSLDLKLTRRWRDSRLRFRNLREDVTHNVVETLSEVWLPELSITGADNLVANSQERKDVNFVDKQDSPLLDDDAELDEDYLYYGGANDLVAVRELTLDLLCHYDLTYYPFDTQHCPLSLLLAKYTSDLFVVRVVNFTFSGNSRHHQYEVLDISIKDLSVNNYSGQLLMLVLRNQYIYYISSAYVPSCMLLIISYLTYFFTLDDFQTRITVALTSLLVLATLFSQLVGSLPKTSYLKLIDVWFLGCIAANFCMVVCLVLIEKRRMSDDDTQKQQNVIRGVFTKPVMPTSAADKVPPTTLGAWGPHLTRLTHSSESPHRDVPFSKSQINTVMK
ncbi:Glutamate-gated chloride channel alpha-like 1, partial [Homarus americanus]